MATKQPAFICSSCLKSLRTQSTNSRNAVRAFSLTSIQHQPQTTEELPRWQKPPPRMQMPHRLRPQPRQPEWKVNNDIAPVNAMYDAFIGSRIGGSVKGKDMLPEEVKWLAITHKSYLHGALGFNDRLAFLGKRIVDLQTNLALLNAPPPPSLTPSALRTKDAFTHPALEGVENITPFAKNAALDRARLAKLAQSYGVDKVVRWKPRKSDNLETSGVDTVLAHTMYSIVGALALQSGGEVAARVARERILQPLGLR